MERQHKVLEIENSIKIIEDFGSELPVSAMLAKSAVPYSHRRTADNYVMMKKLCGFQIAQPRITNSDRALLYRYRMNTLECTTIGQVNLELALLKEWSMSTNDSVRDDADLLLQIRVKELKFILSNKYAVSTNEVYNGYKAIELYLSEITKYYSAS